VAADPDLVATVAGAALPRSRRHATVSHEEHVRRMVAGRAKAKAAREAAGEETAAERRRRLVKAGRGANLNQQFADIFEAARQQSARAPDPMQSQPSAVRPPADDRLVTLIVETVACRHVLEDIRELLRTPPPRLGLATPVGYLDPGPALLASNRGRHGVPGGPLIGIGESSYSSSDARENFGISGSLADAAVGASAMGAAVKISEISAAGLQPVVMSADPARCERHGRLDCAICRFEEAMLARAVAASADGVTVARSPASGAAEGFVQDQFSTEAIRSAPDRVAPEGGSAAGAGTYGAAPAGYDPGVWDEMAGEIAGEDEEAASAVAPAGVEDRLWEGRLAFHRANRMWVPEWGPEPGREGCLVPEWLLGGERR
jgi:hypothetical protein